MIDKYYIVKDGVKILVSINDNINEVILFATQPLIKVTTCTIAS